MPHLLDDPVSKTLRARKHVAELKPLLRDFREGYADALRDEVDADTGEKRWIVDIDPPDLGDDAALIIGEAIYQYRSALDHLAWQLVVANGETPSHRTAFPVVDDPAKWARPNTQNRIEGMHPDAKAYLKSEQPGVGVNRSRTSWLLALEDLWNVDKHRHIYATLSSNSAIFFSPGLSGPGDAFMHMGLLERGTVVATVRPEYAHVNLLFRPSVSFGKGVSCEGENVEMMFSRFDYIVGDIIENCRQFLPPDGPPIPFAGY